MISVSTRPGVSTSSHFGAARCKHDIQQTVLSQQMTEETKPKRDPALSMHYLISISALSSLPLIQQACSPHD
jgi:hypothetical protein